MKELSQRRFLSRWLALLFVATQIIGLSHAHICDGDLVTRLKELQAKHLSSATFLERRLSGATEAPNQWLDRNLKPELISSVMERQALVDLVHGAGLKEGEKIIWMQQGGLKELNEKLWNIGGTEHFLQVMDDELNALLQSGGAALGRRVHTNYKDRVFVSALSPEELQSKVITPLQERVARRLSKEFSGSELDSSDLWKKWIAGNMRQGSGDSLLSAHLSKLGINNDLQYTAAILAARTSGKSVDKLLQKTQSVTLEQLFTQLKQTSEQPGAMSLWLQQKGLKASEAERLIKEAKNYKDHLAIADFLPLPKHDASLAPKLNNQLTMLEQMPPVSQLNAALSSPQLKNISEASWTAQQAQFLANAIDSGQIIAADIKGVGIKGLLERDAWLKMGADKTKIMNIYEKTSKMLNDKTKEISDGLQKICGPNIPIHVYQSGDDLLIALPRVSTGPPLGALPPNTITQAQLDQANIFLGRVENIYAKSQNIAKPGDIKSVSETISRARDSMFDEKTVAK